MEPSVTPLSTRSAGSRPPRWRVVLVGMGAVLWKAKWLLSLLKLSKFAGTALSMVITIAFYAMLFGWRFAVGFVALVFVHEMGHAVMMKWRGVEASAPVFIPFVGAAIAMRGKPRDARMEAEIGIAGPMAGTAAALACWGFFWLSRQPLWLALANVGFVLNLFNLLPISPLDGGRVAGAISKWLWVIGAGLLLVGIIAWHSPILVLVLVMSGMQMWSEFRRPAEETASYYAIAPAVRLGLAVAYFGLAALLGYLSSVSHQTLSLLNSPV